MTHPDTDQIDAVRGFNRFYTRRIGILEEGVYESRFSLTEARVLYELAHGPGATATMLARKLALDPGYLSRLLTGLRRRRLVARRVADDDGRRQHLSLTASGRSVFQKLDAVARRRVRALLAPLDPQARRRLVTALDLIEALLDEQPASPLPYTLRAHRPGDMGWVVERHGAVYAREYGWGAEFEALVADIVADFLKHLDGSRERCWIAEQDGERVGSVFLVKDPGEPRTAARLRLLLVEPRARGLGIGARLVDECVAFARQTGYRKLTLWTNSVLHAARRIYERAGFELVEEAPHAHFGHDLVGQTWALDL